jgi:hypothetical protein
MRNRIAAMTLALILALASPTFTSADQCQWDCHEWTQDGICLQPAWVCLPEYYVWQYSEPDWCLYGFGDEVDVQWQTVNGTLRIVAWYVTPESDPGRDGPAMVTDAGGSCGLFWYPW